MQYYIESRIIRLTNISLIGNINAYFVCFWFCGKTCGHICNISSYDKRTSYALHPTRLNCIYSFINFCQNLLFSITLQLDFVVADFLHEECSREQNHCL